ncbi:unnamed protein product [Orchesella dallaii]|uniref:Uncharacterized protein n=1 Tax=Orchesella dallaii TaxID=48710 RepID=A0ABP1S7N8_9HEXA
MTSNVFNWLCGGCIKKRQNEVVNEGVGVGEATQEMKNQDDVADHEEQGQAKVVVRPSSSSASIALKLAHIEKMGQAEAKYKRANDRVKASKYKFNLHKLVKFPFRLFIICSRFVEVLILNRMLVNQIVFRMSAPCLTLSKVHDILRGFKNFFL